MRSRSWPGRGRGSAQARRRGGRGASFHRALARFYRAHAFNQPHTRPQKAKRSTGGRADGSPGEALAARNQVLIVRLEEGLHRVVMRGPVAGTALSLLVGAPKRVEVTADGWTVAGIDDHDTATPLQFARQGAGGYPLDGTVGQDPRETDGAPSDDSKVSQDLLAWLYVDREIDIGPRWTIKTTVTRLNAGPSPLTIEIPLLEGEQMIESSRAIDDPNATITLADANEAVTWTSVLDPRAKLILAAPAGPWTERWVLSCDAAWQCDAQGIPATRGDGARRVYHPWPGESLEACCSSRSPPRVRASA